VCSCIHRGSTTSLFEPTGSRRDAASVIFNLPGYRVIDAVDLPLGSRRVKVQPVDLADGCPACGVVSGRVHAWVVQRVRDVPYAGQVEVLVRKPRLVCAEPACPRGTFTPATPQLPARARCTTRLKMALLAAVIDSGRAVVEVAAAYQVAWWTVQATVNAAAVLLPEVDQLQVSRLGIDEHRYRRVRWFRDESGGWRRVEPWMSTIVNAASGQVLGIVDGRDSATVSGLAGPAEPGLAGQDRGRRDRPVGGVQEGHHRAATERPDQRRCPPPGAVGEPDGDQGAAATGPRAGAAPRPQTRPGLGTPNSAAPRLRHPLGEGEGAAANGVHQRRPNR
jgi:Helix-turn-helix domain of transposase family ISL3/zinc-finger of transposase IS204/IS1001/IS1096/IS1165